MFRHWIWIIAASVVLALTMVACGEDEEPEQVVIAEPPVSAGAEEEQAEPPTPIVAVIVTPTPAEEEADQAEAEATPAEGEAEATPTGEAEAEATPAEEEAEATPTGEAETEATSAGEEADQAEADATPTEEAEAEATPAEATPAGEEAEVDTEQLISQGEEIYSANCAACHGPDGQGGGEYPALAGNEFLTGDPAQAIEVVHNGRGAMPAFGEQLSNEEIAAVLSYERNSWGNEAEAITPDQVAQVAEGGEAGETTEAEATPTGEAEAEATPAEEAEAEATPTPAEEAETQAEPGPTAEGTPEEGTEEEETDKPSETETPVSGEAADPEQLVTIGEGIYQSYCAACHQPDGQGVQAQERGVAPIYPPLAGNPFVTAEDPNAVTLTVLTGRAGMPRFRDMLENEQIAAVVSYIRNAWDNDASTISTQEVEQILQNFLDRPEPNDKEGSMARKTPTATPAASD